MAFRTETKACAGLILWTALAAADPAYDVQHKHLRHSGAGVLRIDESSVSFEETGKQTQHSRTWKYDDIQQLTLGLDTVRIVTYEDNRWELGRDRVYVFDHVPATVARDWYPVFRARLDQRFVAAFADDQVNMEWEIPVKLMHGRAGSQGVLRMAEDRLVYNTGQDGESRTWRIRDLENVSSSGPFDLTLTTQEREFRFQLKQPLTETRYQQLWMRINQSHGLQILTTAKQPPE